MNKLFLAASFDMLLGSPTFAQSDSEPPVPAPNGDIKQDVFELKKGRQDLLADKKDIKEDRKNLRSDLRDLRHDRRTNEARRE